MYMHKLEGYVCYRDILINLLYTQNSLNQQTCKGTSLWFHGTKVNGWFWAPNPGGRSPHHKACNRSSDVEKRWSKLKKKIGIKRQSYRVKMWPSKNIAILICAIFTKSVCRLIDTRFLFIKRSFAAPSKNWFKLYVLLIQKVIVHL